MKMLNRLNHVALNESRKFALSRERLSSYLNGFPALLEKDEHYPADFVGLVEHDAKDFGRNSAESVLKVQGDYKFHFGLCLMFGVDRRVQAILHCTAKVDPDRVILGFNGSDQEFVMPDAEFINTIERIIIDRMENLGVDANANNIRFLISAVSKVDKLYKPIGFCTTD